MLARIESMSTWSEHRPPRKPVAPDRIFLTIVAVIFVGAIAYITVRHEINVQKTVSPEPRLLFNEKLARDNLKKTGTPIQQAFANGVFREGDEVEKLVEPTTPPNRPPALRHTLLLRSRTARLSFRSNVASGDASYRDGREIDGDADYRRSRFRRDGCCQLLWALERARGEGLLGVLS
jgi:hypothetical protein